jgi:hypothetical protein
MSEEEFIIARADLCDLAEGGIEPVMQRMCRMSDRQILAAHRLICAANRAANAQSELDMLQDPQILDKAIEVEPND